MGRKRSTTDKLTKIDITKSVPRNKLSDIEKYNLTFATNLRNYLIDNGISQKLLAENIGVSSQTISNICLGETDPSLEQLTLICKSLNVSADYLLGITNYMTTKYNVADIGKQTGLIEPILIELTDKANIRKKYAQLYFGGEPVIRRLSNNKSEITPMATCLNYLYSIGKMEFIADLWKYINVQKKFKNYCSKYEEISEINSDKVLEYLSVNEITEDFTLELEADKLRNDLYSAYTRADKIYNNYQELRLETIYLKDKVEKKFSAILSENNHPKENKINNFLQFLKMYKPQNRIK